MIAVHPIAGALGAEIAGIDLARPLDDATVAAIRRAWLEHQVVFFRDQDLTPPQFLAFARRFGEPNEYPFVKGLPEAPEVIPVLKQAHETVNFGGIWHSDTTYLERPPMASLLIAREVPRAGGDTEYASMYRASRRCPRACGGCSTRWSPCTPRPSPTPRARARTA